MADRLLDRLLDLIAEENQRTARRRSSRLAELEGRVADYLAAHPDASANAVARAVPGRRVEVLALVRQLRLDDERFPADGNQ